MELHPPDGWEVRAIPLLGNCLTNMRECAGREEQFAGHSQAILELHHREGLSGYDPFA
jgi:hypothetical protein